MKNLIIKAGSFIAGSALLLLSVSPAAANTITVGGNGFGSTNNITVSNTNTTSVNQTNNSSVTTTINTSANTGFNTIRGNTGGSTFISTGPASSNVDVVTGGNTNILHLEGSCGCNQGSNVSVIGNGAFSHNSVSLNNTNQQFINQNNYQNVRNSITTNTNTGHNIISGNTGGYSWFYTHNHFPFFGINNGGSSSIVTGAADNNIRVKVDGSTNIIH